MTNNIATGGWLRALYSIVLTILIPFIYLYLWWHGRNNPAYRQRWRERGGWQQVPTSAQRSVVFHCVSVGELMAAKPLIEAFLDANPQQPVTITSMTPTGSALIEKLFGDRVYHCYLPFDTPLAVRRFINRVKPRGLIILETELWPNLVSQCHQAHISIMLVNARMSERSAAGYQKARFIMQPVWRMLDAVVAQDEASAARFKALGCQPERVSMLGNIKYDVQVNHAMKAAIEGFKPLLGARQVITVGSTHEGEEAVVLAAFQRLLQARPDTLLILVPRHQERFGEVAQLVTQYGLSMVKRSEGRPVTADTQVLLADSMGEMLLWFGVSTIATVGGSLIERGGHNPLEAMAFGLPIVSGRHVFNFADVYRQLDARQAVRWVNNEQALHDTWLGLLVEPATAQRIGAQAQQLFARHRGATQRILSRIAEVLMQQRHCARARLQDGAQLLYDATLVKERPQSQHFAPDFWQQLKQQSGRAGGRNLAYFVQADNALSDLPMVLRHYYRGGLIGKVNRDWFMGRVSYSRSHAEFELLQWMHQQGLPVPRPIAARVKHHAGVFYSADILIERLPCDGDLFGVLKQQSLAQPMWEQIGEVIARLHQQHVYHSDLNCHNILVHEAAHQVWLIDFDKCERRTPGHWQHENLQRLRRSFDKEGALHQSFHFGQQQWDWLLQGYQRVVALS